MKTVKTNKVRVMLSVSAFLLAAADRQAVAEHTSRSDLVRRALMEYMRSDAGQAEELDLYTNPDELLDILRQRTLRLSIRKMLNNRRRKP